MFGRIPFAKKTQCINADIAVQCFVVNLRTLIGLWQVTDSDSTNVFGGHLHDGMVELVVGKEHFERVVSIVEERHARGADVA